MFRVLLRQRVKGRPRRREARAVLCPPFRVSILDLVRYAFLVIG
jgi:hypothetical protein